MPLVIAGSPIPSRNKTVFATLRHPPQTLKQVLKLLFTLSGQTKKVSRRLVFIPLLKLNKIRTYSQKTHLRTPAFQEQDRLCDLRHPPRGAARQRPARPAALGVHHPGRGARAVRGIGPRPGLHPPVCPKRPHPQAAHRAHERHGGLWTVPGVVQGGPGAVRCGGADCDPGLGGHAERGPAADASQVSQARKLSIYDQLSVTTMVAY
jgi:hypothetical protein